LGLGILKRNEDLVKQIDFLRREPKNFLITIREIVHYPILKKILIGKFQFKFFFEEVIFECLKKKRIIEILTDSEKELLLKGITQQILQPMRKIEDTFLRRSFTYRIASRWSREEIMELAYAFSQGRGEAYLNTWLRDNLSADEKRIWWDF